MARYLTLIKARSGEVVGRTLVDDADYEHLSRWNWYVSDGGYAMRATTIRNAAGNRQFLAIRLHRYLMGLEAGDRREVDHRNRDKLDNRRSNLRVTTHAENHQNKGAKRTAQTSAHRGVDWRADRGKWRAAYAGRDQRKHIGYFDTEDEAAAAAAAWRREHLPFAIELDEVGSLETGAVEV
jgi:hypothetical protein